MTLEGQAEALSLSTMTVPREWAKARALLYRELRGDGDALEP